MGPMAGRKGAKNLAYTGIRCRNRPALSDSLYPLRYLGPKDLGVIKLYFC